MDIWLVYAIAIPVAGLVLWYFNRYAKEKKATVAVVEGGRGTVPDQAADEVLVRVYDNAARRIYNQYFSAD